MSDDPEDDPERQDEVAKRLTAYAAKLRKENGSDPLDLDISNTSYGETETD